MDRNKIKYFANDIGYRHTKIIVTVVQQNVSMAAPSMPPPILPSVAMPPPQAVRLATTENTMNSWVRLLKYYI